MTTATNQPRKQIELSTKAIAAIIYAVVSAALVFFNVPLERALVIALISLPVTVVYGGLVISEMITALNEKTKVNAVLGWISTSCLWLGVLLTLGGIRDLHIGFFLTGIACFGISVLIVKVYPDAVE